MLSFRFSICLAGLFPAVFPALFSQQNIPAPALEIPLAFQAEPAPPVVVPDSSNGRSFVFFFPAKAPYADQYPCQVFETSAPALQLQRSGPVSNIRIEWGWKSAPKPLGSCQDEQNVYLWLLDHEQVLPVRINKSDLTVHTAPAFQLKSRNDILGVAPRGDHVLLLLKEKRRRDKSVVKIIRLQADAYGPAQELPAAQLYGLFSKDFQPAQTASGIPGDPAQAASPYRLFDSGRDTIWITHDGRFGPEGLETALLRLYTFDLKNGTARLDELPYLPSGPQTGIAAKGASYIAAGKLFQLYVTHAQYNLLVRDLGTRKVLNHERTGLGEALPLFNAPVFIPKNFLQKEATDPAARLLNASMETLPYLLVEPAADGFRLHLGGSRVASGDLWLAPFIQPVAAMGILLQHWSAQNSFSLYRILDHQNLNVRPQPVLTHTFFQTCAGLSDRLNVFAKRATESVYRLGGRTYLGVFDGKGGRYGFYEVEGW